MSDCILILEDEPFIALDLESALDENGHYDHVTFSTCSSAAEWLDENSPSTAIIDPRLSDGVCANVVRTLADRGVPFVVYSGDLQAVSEIEPAFASGELILKPCPPERLLDAVERALKETDRFR